MTARTKGNYWENVNHEGQPLAVGKQRKGGLTTIRDLRFV